MASVEVLIIESRSPSDYFESRQEGKTLQEVLKLEEVNAKYLEVIDKHHFERAIKHATKGNISYVHFGCHGNSDGIELTSGEFICWQEFDKLAWPYLKGKCLAFSSCDVAQGVEKIFGYHKLFCNAIVAPTREITWSEGLVAFTAFYHKATSGDTSAKQDVRVMNNIVGRGTFKFLASPSRDTTFVIGPD